MEELPIFNEGFKTYVEIIKNSTYYQSGKIDDSPQILDDLFKRLESFGYETAYIESIENIYWVYHELYDDIFNKILSSKDYKNADVMYYFEIDNPKNVKTIHIFEIIKIKKPRRRKNIDDLKEELHDALKNEDYQMAAKLRDKIKLKELKKGKK